MSEVSNFSDNATQARQTTERIPKFIGIISQMIEDPRYQEYVSWSQDGCAILIKKPTEFAEYVLPIFFKHSNFSSFVRQLNLYSFRKKKHYPFENAFVQGMFKRGQKGLLVYIKRKGNEKYPNYIQEAEPHLFHNDREADSAYDELCRQNTYLKKIHQDLTEHVQNIGDKAAKLSRANEILQAKYLKKTQEEELLTKVLKNLTKIHGEEAIKRAYQAVVQKETHPSSFFEPDCQEHLPEAVLFSKNASMSTTDSCPQDRKLCMNYKGLCDDELMHSSRIAELYLQKDRLHHVDYDARFDSDRSTPTHEKSNSVENPLDRVLNEKKTSQNLTNLGFQNGTSFEQSLCANRHESQELYFDGNFNMIDNGFNSLMN